MFKATLYDKTARFSPDTLKMLITEKLDGSNLCFYVEEDEAFGRTLYIAQRNWVFTFGEVIDAKEGNKDIRGRLYKGLMEWVLTYGQWLEDNLRLNSIICGEWMEANKGRYKDTEIEKHPYYMFAKANWDDNHKLTNFCYDPDFFHYAFENQDYPTFIRPVPVVARFSLNEINFSEGTFLDYLDSLYGKYREEQGERKVEGFVTSYLPTSGHRMKYVRQKSAKNEVVPHQYWGYNGKKVMK